MKSEKRAWLGPTNPHTTRATIKRPDHITCPDMHVQPVALGEIGDGDAGDERPVKHAHERIPHIDLWRSSHAIRIEHAFTLCSRAAALP